MDIKVIISVIMIALMSVLLPSKQISAQTPDAPVALRTVVIDPGHGGKDPGAPGPDSKNSEKHIVLKISKLLGEKINNEYPDVRVVYTRTGDTFPKLTDRIKIANDNKADLFISIHCNANKNKSVSGSSAHILSRKDSRNPNRDLFDENLELTRLENSVIEFEDDQSKYSDDSPEDQILNTLLFHANFDHSVLFAQLVVEKLAVKPFHKWGKGIHQNDFHLLKKMTCPAVLIETAFLSNTNERQLLVSSKWQEEIAQRLFEAFKEYKSIYDGSITSSTSSVQNHSADSFSDERPEEYYSIQLMSLGRELDASDPALKGLEAHYIKTDSSLYKYMCGVYSSKDQAYQRLDSVRNKFPQAFVVKIQGNSSTPVNSR